MSIEKITYWMFMTLVFMVLLLFAPFVVYFPYAFFSLLIEVQCDGCSSMEAYGKYGFLIFMVVFTTIFCICYFWGAVHLVKMMREK